ncbi:hypothetical protein [Salinibius halmophilus]|uniref:hypothetical protein n=1 Tax=Salinibius halmophilus TaxID=1853216 RepID=UPI000E66F930|nr:hypothetical protein [Salinibius halmophilus]
MNTTNELLSSELTPAAFKDHIVDFVKNPNCSAELLRQVMAELPSDKQALFEEYKTSVVIDEIGTDKYEWERPGYFEKQLFAAKKNFCQRRLNHLLEVKSYLTQRGVAGFSKPVQPKQNSTGGAENNKDNPMKSSLASVNLQGFTPSPSLENCVQKGDLSAIRVALFMELNDERLPTETIKQAFAWVRSKQPNLFVAYEENAYAKAMSEDSSKWTDDYYHLQEVYASSNFSEERISHMIEVREHVFKPAKAMPPIKSISRPAQVTVAENAKPQTTRRSRSAHPAPEKQPTGNNSLQAMLLVGGAAAALAIVVLAVLI